MMRFRLLALAALISIAGGCLSHREYRHIYTLDGAVDAPAQEGTDAQRPVMQLERVLVPDYLDTTDIVLRLGTHEIHESATGRFGERLSLGVTRALRSDLALRLPRYIIALSGYDGTRARQILVNVDAFDVWPTGRCVLVADWSILEADRRTVLSAGRGTFTTAAGGVNPPDGAIVAAMADAVRQLADRIASSARALPPQRRA
ncbi:MAG TPA: PqiC family protein [Steroidobacteraceae bacterium]|nr:PqiC family protein [Steroidobacteraceae bacterium]HUA23667.1 PqiC family protein [Steroidobacteraceae bacterium]